MKNVSYPVKDRKIYVEQNRRAWNAVAPVHAQANHQRLLKEVADPKFMPLDTHTRDRLLKVGVEGKSVAQVCCNNGQELLSVKHLGAGRCVGFDLSEAFIDQANALRVASGLDEVEFVNTDVYELPAQYSGRFDIVFNTVGVLGWMPDIVGYFAVCSRLTRAGGYLLIEDMHPVLQMYDDSVSDQPSAIRYSYFRAEPWKEADNLDYYEGTDYDAPVNCFFKHTLSAIMMAAIDHGFQLRHFEELDYDISTVCPDLEHVEAQPPMGMVLVWEKT